MRAQRVAVVYNPSKRGMALVRRRFAEAETRLGIAPASWFESDASDAGAGAARKALATKPDVVVAVGGDGTVRAVASVLEKTGIPLGIVPRGTGNLLARNLDLSITDLRQAVSTALEGHIRHIDVPHITVTDEAGTRESMFLVMAGLGIDAEMAALTNPKLKSRIGWLAYLAPILRAALRNERKEVTVVLESGVKTRRKQNTALIGNCGVIAGGVLLMPEAKLDDGMVDVLALNPKSAWGWMRIARRLMVGSALRNSPQRTQILRGLPTITSMRYRQAPRVEWRMDEPVRVQIDGDPFGEVTRAVVEVHAGALSVRT